MKKKILLSLLFLILVFCCIIIFKIIKSRPEFNDIVIQSLGLAANKIVCSGNVIYLDAFAENVNVPDYKDATIILITHDDHDHFNASKVNAALAETSAIVIAPQTVTQKIDKNYSKRIITMEPKKNNPVKNKIKNFSITAYRTIHFNYWPALNNSYLLEINNKKIFISGDSVETKGFESEIKEADLYVFCYLKWVKEDELLPKMKLKTKGKLYITHLLNCSWAAKPISILNFVKDNNYKNVIVHQEIGESTIIK